MWNFVRLRNYHSWWCYWMNMNLASIGRWRQRQRKNVRNIFLATGSSIKLRTERKNVPELCVVYPIVVPEREIVRISFLYCYNNYNIRWRLDEIFFFFEIFLARIVAYYESWQAFCGYGVQKIDSSYICFYLCPLILFLALSLEAVPLIVNYDISLFHARHFSEWSHCLACVFWVRRYFFHFCYALSFRVYDNVIKNELHYFVKYARR